MSPKLGRWVRLFVDYAGLVAFLVTIAVTGDAIAASWAVVAGSLAALAVGLGIEKRLAPMPLATAVIGVLFGGATLYFHDKRIIKMKLTILDGGIAVFLLSGLLRGKNPLKALMGETFHLPQAIVRTITLRYALFFLALAAGNEIIWRGAEHLYGPGKVADRVWGLYKFPGTVVLIFLFALSQTPLLLKHAEEPKA